MTYDDALTLLGKGHFHEVIDGFKQTRNAQSLSTDQQVLWAYVSALTGDESSPPSLSNINATSLTANARSLIETTRGIVASSVGDHKAAWHHLQAGVRFAREARAPERLAWAYLHLFRCAIETEPSDTLKAILRDVRAAVVSAGVPTLAAYLHVCVSTFEGQRGNIDQAARHCDIAESLLEIQSHAWILGNSLINRSCVACLRCDFSQAAEQIQRARALTTINGSRMHRIATENLSGYVHLLAGNFDRAQRILNNVLLSEVCERAKADTADLLARVYLATGDTHKCENAMAFVGLSDDFAETDRSTYGKRWASLTKAKLLIKRHEFAAAVTWLQAVEARTGAINDRSFNAAIDLLSAQALHRLGKARECARRILDADSADIRQSATFQGQFEYTVGTIVRHGASSLARQMRERALAIWSSQGIVSVRAEIDDGIDSVVPGLTDRNSAAAQEREPVLVAINSISAALDLAHHPRLLGAELLHLAKMAGRSFNVSLAETAEDSNGNLDSSARRMTLHLGDGARPGRSVTLSCDVPDAPLDAIALADVFRIGRAAVALEKARLEQRRRAALWPSEPVEEQAGALFVAEEMQTLLDTARRAARANIPVLITGETGTGKEVLARLIHTYSPRANKTFLPFNCSATPREMLDAQLFGHRRGAFTGATENFAGVIRAAAGGTLFLDEIGESTLDIQPKLLRFLESGEVHPIGETHPQRVDVRVVAATNADVDSLVSQGRFREDLFYRLNIVRLPIPPLRERRVEIPVFANHYLQKYAKEMNKGELRLAEDTMEYLVLYRWPGNVRQLANEMRRLAALAEPGAVLMPEHLSADIAASRRTIPASDRTLDASEIVVRIDQSFGAAIQHLERAMVEAALAKTKSVDEAAKLLGVSRKGLYLKRLRYGLEIDRPMNVTEVADRHG